MAGPEPVAVVGVGHTRYGKLPEYDAYELGLWALKEALADCSLGFEDIDGLISRQSLLREKTDHKHRSTAP